MSFNPDQSKRAQEIFFSKKSKKSLTLHCVLMIFHDTQFSFEENLKVITTKVNKTRTVAKIARLLLMAKYKAFVDHM